MPRPPRAASSCRICLAWGDHFYTDLCMACAGWGRKYPGETCRCCRQQAACKAGYCRPCRVQASFNHDHRKKTKMDLETPRRTGYQLRFADMVRSAQIPPKPAQKAPVPALRPIRPRPLGEQLTCCTAKRDIRRVPLHGLELPHPEFTAFVLARAEELGRIRGWTDVVLIRARRALTILTAVHDPFEPILASTVEQLAERKLSPRRAMEVLLDLQLLVDDRPDALTEWIRRNLAGIPDGIRTEVEEWVSLMRKGGQRSLPRAPQTVINKVRLALPFLAWAATGRGYTTLRQATREDCKGWLDTLDHDRQRTIVALRGLFKTLKTSKLIFANPTRYIRCGSMARSIPTPLAPHRLAAAATSAASDPTLRVVLALAAIQAITAAEIQAVLLDYVDLPNDRIVLRGVGRPLDDYTRQALTDYLELRHKKWPRTANPHLLVSKRTAHELGPTTHTWMAARLRAIGITVTELRADRILEEAAATSGDALHLATMFGMSAGAAVRYADAVRQAPST